LEIVLFPTGILFSLWRIYGEKGQWYYKGANTETEKTKWLFLKKKYKKIKFPKKN